MTFGTMEVIQTITVGAGGQAAIEFLNIPSTYNDLLIKLSVRSDEAGGTAQSTGLNMSINGVTTNRTFRTLIGYQGTLTATTTGTTGAIGTIPGASVTASTFNNFDVYIPGYAGGLNKAFLVDAVTENASGTNNELRFTTGLWSQTTAISSLSFSSAAGNIVQHSTATLYGITRVPAGAKATGGVIYDDASYWYHVFTSSGTFTPNQNITCDYLVVAGGGAGGGGGDAGGGGAGGMRCTVDGTGGSGSLETPLSLIANTSYTVTVGAGGAVATNAAGNNGSNSVFATITATGGGGGGKEQDVATAGAADGKAGGSGGGSGNRWIYDIPQGGAASPSGQGFAGGNSAADTDNAGGGGGGASAAGGNAATNDGGNGGNGRATSISGTSVTYAGGGGGGVRAGGTLGTGGTGGGGKGSLGTTAADAGTANTGGGGGGANNPNTANQRAGGSGIVIVRYAK